jgi:hypothetical protein
VRTEENDGPMTSTEINDQMARRIYDQEQIQSNQGTREGTIFIDDEASCDDTDEEGGADDTEDEEPLLGNSKRRKKQKWLSKERAMKDTIKYRLRKRDKKQPGWVRNFYAKCKKKNVIRSSSNSSTPVKEKNKLKLSQKSVSTVSTDLVVKVGEQSRPPAHNVPAQSIPTQRVPVLRGSAERSNANVSKIPGTLITPDTNTQQKEQSRDMYRIIETLLDTMKEALQASTMANTRAIVSYIIKL